MKKIIAYIAMAAIIAALLTACGDGRITDNTVTSPGVTPGGNTEVMPGVVSPNVTGTPDDGVVGDIEDMFEDENDGRNDMLNSPAVTAKP
ncbi:MAG: hypothetical protein MSO56_03650 [Clostridiales bacterium]|nr:hypothetical protein [Clostridiales bacterium]